MRPPSKYIWHNGQLVEFEKATLHFLTPALHYGVAVFEGIRCYATADGPAVFRLKEHIHRLVQSSKVLGVRQLPFSEEEMANAVRQTVAANGFEECYIRPVIYLDEGGWNLSVDSAKPKLAIAVWEWKNYLGEESLEKGIRANISSYTRHHPNVMMTKAKISGNYVNSVLAKTESERLGFDEAIMLDPQGFVAECTGENIFLVRNNKVYTPPTHTVLEGITRDTIFTLCNDLGIDVIEQPISRDHLYIADEVFVSGTAAEVIALTEIDFRVIGNGKMGPVTRAVQKAYHNAVRGLNPHSAEWCDVIRIPVESLFPIQQSQEVK